MARNKHLPGCPNEDQIDGFWFAPGEVQQQHPSNYWCGHCLQYEDPNSTELAMDDNWRGLDKLWIASEERYRTKIHSKYISGYNRREDIFG